MPTYARLHELAKLDSMARTLHFTNLFTTGELERIARNFAATPQLARTHKEPPKMTKTRYQLTWNKPDGTRAQGTVKCIKPDGLQKLADMLNQGRPNRDYKVVEIHYEETERTQLEKAG